MTTINNLPILDLAGLSAEAVSLPVVNTTSTTPDATFQLPLSAIALLAQGDPGYTGSHGEKGDPGIPGYTGSQGVGYTGSEGPIGPPGPTGNPGGFTGSTGLMGYTGSASIGNTVNLSTITQSITPSSSDIYDLGAGGRFWKGVYTAELYVNSGNIKDLNTGLPIEFNTTNTVTAPNFKGTKLSSSVLPSFGTVLGDAWVIYNAGSPGVGQDANGSAWVYTAATGGSSVNGFVYIGQLTGYTGSSGRLGYTGSFGVGYTGSQGITGYDGSNGQVGYTGSAGLGYTGSAGLGYTGSAGLGYAGSVGAMGYTGSAGSGGGTSGINVWDEDLFVGTFANLNFVGASVVASTQSTSSGGYAAITLSAGTGTGAIGYTGSAGLGYTGSAGLGYTGSAGVGYTGSAGTGGTGTIDLSAVSQSIIPSVDVGLALGSNAKRWEIIRTASVQTSGIIFVNPSTSTSAILSTPDGIRLFWNSTVITGGASFVFQNVGFNYSVDGFSDTTYPTLTLVRGQIYNFNFTNVTSSHPIALRLTDGGTSAVPGTAGNDASSGVYGSGTTPTIVTYQVPFDAPSKIYYQCVYHSGMIGEINIIDRDTYTATTPSSWAGTAPTTITDALDRLAALVKTLAGGIGA